MNYFKNDGIDIKFHKLTVTGDMSHSAIWKLLNCLKGSMWYSTTRAI